MIEVSFIKPFKRIIEGGSWGNSLIAFSKSPWVGKVDESGKIKITKHYYFIYINLWIINFYIRFTK